MAVVCQKEVARGCKGGKDLRGAAQTVRSKERKKDAQGVRREFRAMD